MTGRDERKRALEREARAGDPQAGASLAAMVRREAEFRVTVRGVPRTKNKPWAAVIGGRPRIIRGAKERQNQLAFAAVIEDALPPGWVPYEGPVELELVFTFPAPKSWPRWKREAALAGRFHHVSRPDLSRLVTFAEDALSGVVFGDDAQVRSILADKAYGVVPATQVMVRSVPQAERER